jgi:hypothetical protein
MKKFRMKEIQISDEMFSRVSEFKRVIIAVIDEELEFETCVEIILNEGLDSMLADLVGSQHNIILESLKQLAARYPPEIYGYFTEMMEIGTPAEKEGLKKKLGFPLNRDHEK